MKLLIIGHTYITAINQAKYVAMKRLDPQLRLRIVVPQVCNDIFAQHKPERHCKINPEDMVVLPSIFNRSITMSILHPLRLVSLLKAFKPDVIHIEEDPHSIIGIETVFLSRLACPTAKISFFIWDNIARDPEFPLNLIKNIFTRFSLSRCQLVICGNNEGQHLLRQVKKYKGLSMVLPQFGLDPDDFNGPMVPGLSKQLGKVEGRLLIGFLGRLVPEKGVLLLLEAVSKIKSNNWTLLIVGNGPLKETIRTQWQDLLGKQLEVLDGVSRELYRQYLRCIEVLAVPSYSLPSWKEQFGYNIAEAMMVGVPCIGSSSGAIPEVMGPGGLVFKEKDVAALTTAMERMIEEGSLRKELGLKARAFALENYTNDVIAGKYLTAFKRLINP
ncbi:MAG: glycosyltransferase family 4 protein [Candidatus Edwardsbacteria bacterium]|nr:glycosyltransferase family 4 protein [Candidatus Edwardsbacteria bacterium]